MKSYNIVNGNIVTLNSSIPIAESLSIKNGKIQFINKLDKDLENINLHGATVIPGFIDAHFHLKNFGKRLEQVDLKNINSLDINDSTYVSCYNNCHMFLLSLNKNILTHSYSDLILIHNYLEDAFIE